MHRLRLRFTVVWLILLAFPLSWFGGVPQAKLCVRADGTVAVEAHGDCDGDFDGSALPARLTGMGYALSTGSADCGVCSDFPLRVHIPSVITTAVRSAHMQRALAVIPHSAPASFDALEVDQGARARASSAGHTPLAALRTVILLI